jgi:hypothetical protein
LNGEYNRAFGLRWNNYTTGSDSVIQVGSSAHFSKVQRCYLIDCGTGTGNVNAGVIQFLAPVQGAIAEYNRVKTAQGYSALKFTTTGNPAVATQNCVMRYNDLSDSANMIISHGGAGVRAGTDAFGGSVFEYNYASNARGSTGIGGQIKGSDITIRQNTFVNCGYMHSRHGYECNWISNTFDNTSGPILWGKGHLLIGNYISRSGSFGAAGPAPGSFVQDLGTALPGWTPGGGRYPRGEDIVCVGNVGPGVLSLNSTITASPTLNTKDTRLWQNSVSIDYGRNIGLDPLLPSYSTDPVSETIIPRIVLNSTLVGPTAAGAPNP